MRKIEICIGTDRAKIFRARLSLLIIEDGQVLAEHYHSITIEPGANLASIRTMNEAHLADPAGGIPGAPWPKIPNAEWNEVIQHIGIVHKPEVVARFIEEKQARIAAEEVRNRH